MFDGLESADKDPTKSLHVGDVADARAGARRGLRRGDGVEHQLQHGVDVDLRAAADVRLPRPPRPGERVGRPPRARTYHVVGSDAAGVVLRVGSAVRNWKPGDRVTIHCNSVDDQDPSAHDDSMLAANQRIWGFETNFGGLADLTVVKANQLMPKPTHLTWEEAAVNALCNSTSYRMLVGQHGARMKQGDAVLVWGATGGIGGYAVQYVLNGGGTPVGVVSSPEKAELLNELGVEAVIDRKAEGYRFWSDAAHPGRVRVAALRQAGPRARRRRPRHRVRAPRPPDDGRVDLRLQARRHGRHVRGDVGLHGRVRQPPLLDEAEAADRQPLRQLRRGLGRQPADRPGPHPAAAVGGAPADRGRRGRPGGPPQRARGQDRRAVPGAARRASASTTPRSASASARTRSPCSAA